MTPPWWQGAVVYQIYPRSFADGDGDGIGDLVGLRRRLEHLAWLGVDGLWLSPVFPSPMADFGYDVADYCDVDPTFGSLADLDAVIAEAHRLGLRVLLDWVPNHTSDQHPWFVEARSSRTSAKRDWYIWRDGDGPDAPPNNWVRAWSQRPAWTWDDATGQWYLHCFLPAQPDLNWANPELRRAMADVLRFWLDRGVDGFRMDVIHLIGKDPDLGDDPPELAELSHVPLNDRPETHEYLRDLREVLDAYPGDRTAVGEVYLLDTAAVASYTGSGDELPLVFNFRPLYGGWDAGFWAEQVAIVEQEFAKVDAFPTWVLSNHDISRHRTRFGGDEGRARAAAVLLLGLRGTAFLYAGEELGLDDADVPAECVVDPGGRDGCRAPLPWTGDAGHGWDGAEPWLPFAADAEVRNVARQREDRGSVLWLYRRLLTARRSSPALRWGELELLSAPEGVLAWRRRHGDDERILVVGFGADDHEVALPGIGGVVEVASDGAGEGLPFDGALVGTRALVLRPG